MRNVTIAPSILSCDFGNMRAEAENAVGAGASILHVDVMDGHFVPNLTFGPSMVKALRKTIRIPLDIHLMVEEPLPLIPAFLDAAGPLKGDILTIHQEACRDLKGTIEKIRSLAPDILVGVSIKPATPVSVLEGMEEMIDLVLLMTVEPGFGGQGLMEEVLPKIGETRELFRKAGKDILIELDGGVKIDNLYRLMEADYLVMGSAVFKAGDPDKTARNLHEIHKKLRELQNK
ncbi:MAG: ribulose-phosphate 3-epimerase [Firmicutes bacterium]|nr:ribulose-phosphate 3-epimerase [Bacillota bacterium]